MAEDVLSTLKSKGSEVVDYIQMAAQGVYYDAQARKLGLDPSDPRILDHINQRLNDSKNLPLEEWVMRSPNESVLSAATRKANQEKTLMGMLLFYERKYRTPRVEEADIDVRKRY